MIFGRRPKEAPNNGRMSLIMRGGPDNWKRLLVMRGGLNNERRHEIVEEGLSSSKGSDQKCPKTKSQIKEITLRPNKLQLLMRCSLASVECEREGQILIEVT